VKPRGSGVRQVRGAVPTVPRTSLSDRPVGTARAAQTRLTRRARRLAVVVALACGVALGSWLDSLFSGGTEVRLAGESSVVVQSGDSLWSIATSVAGEGDVRAVVAEILQVNGLDSVELTPGQVLRLP
jgi:nucleoid-associated protein YgaU